MSNPSPNRRAVRHRLRTAVLLLVVALPLASVAAQAQQDYVPRYNLYAGYAFLDSPHVSLFENGLHFQAGVNPKTWYALGFDYSVTGGDMTLTPDLLTTAWQQQLGALLQGLAMAGENPCGIHGSGKGRFQDPNLRGRAAVVLSPFQKGDSVCAAVRRSDL